MRFNPIAAAQRINETYRDYMKSTFFINDEEFREEYFHELDMLNFANGPYLECVDAFAHGKSLKQLVDEDVLSSSFDKLMKDDRIQYERALFLHQEQAIRVSQADKNMIVTTGTGSGKTECFLYPVLNYLLEQESAGKLNSGVRVLLLYPMNALANDQMQRLRQLLESYPSITFGAYTGETEDDDNKALQQYQILHKRENPLKNERISRNQMKESPPHILVTNYAMLEYLLIRPTDTVFFDNPDCNDNWKFIVLDEAHVYSGASGMEVSILLRRLIHRLPHTERIRFILTSATLGNENKNQEIIQFATSLCANAEFEASSIIRATRRVMDFPVDFTGNEQLYQAVSDLISEDRVQLEPNTDGNVQALINILKMEPAMLKWIQNNAMFQEILYDVFCHDTLYAAIRKNVIKGAISLTDILVLCSVSDSSLLNFIQIASFAVKNHGKLLDARYHHFIKTLEGAYVSFYPKKTLSLVPRKSVRIDDKDYRCFKLSVCQFCGEMYLEGTINGNSFVQQEGEKKQFYMVIQPEFLDFLDDEDTDALKKTIKKRSSAFRLCTSCGTISRYAELPMCACNNGGHILLYNCPVDEEDMILHTCSHCKTTNPKGSILRGFYLGQDASTAVVGEALFENIPETFIKRKNAKTQRKNPFKKITAEEEPRKTRRLLLFSDSRQEAAYFAAYFQYTYNVILYRRIIMEAARNLMKQFPSHYKNGISILHLIDEMIPIMSTVLGSKASPSSVKKEVYKALIGELKDFSRNSLHSIGWLDYQLPEDALISEGYEEDTLLLSADDLNNLGRFFLEYCMHHGALQLPDSVKMTAEDWSSITFSNREPLIQKQRSGVGVAEGSLRSIVPVTHNAITEYMSRVFPASIDEYKKFLTMIFDEYLNGEDFKILVSQSNKSTYFKINPDKIRILVQGYHPIQHYRCSICGRITTININDKCTSYRCSGALVPYKFDASDTKAYFVNQYGQDAPLIPLSIKEHTAQLSKATAQEYQQRFIDGDINMLSCSTTFEMGVDVGDLETVFMKNVPPRPSNYIQRAGRAGRRLNSAAFSLTFCKLGPHDFYYYQRPTDMINGTISPPAFKIDNPKIVKRHVFAVLLSFYWRKYFADKKQIQDLFSEASLKAIVDSLKEVPNEVVQYLQQVVPNTLNSSIHAFIEEYRNVLLPEVARLYQADIEEYNHAISMEDSKPEKKNYSLLNWLDKVRQTYQQEQILVFYSRYNLIPKYGFPVDTVTLFTDFMTQGYKNNNSKLMLQRDLIQAISEYAPESEVVADGMMYTSQYVKKPLKIDTTWKQYLVSLCDDPACNKVVIEPYTGQTINGKTVCSSCGSQSVLPQIMIIPEFGFIIKPLVVEVTTKRPTKTPRTEFYYLGVFNNERAKTAKQYSFGSVRLSVISSPDDRLLVMNKSEFLVCQTCGYAEMSHGRPYAKVQHSNPRGYACNDTALIKRSLGHTFRTDVALITVNWIMSQDEAITILYALLEGCSRYFDIERDDIDGCLSYQSYAAEGGNTGTTFVLFDSVPGGAGNVKRLYDSNRDLFMNFLQCALDRVRNCDCGNDGDTVCYSCLCNFKNQHYQERMQRRYAVVFFERLLES